MCGTGAHALAMVIARYVTEATVTDNELVTPTMRRIRLVAGEPIAYPYTPGQHIRIQIDWPLSMQGILRPGGTLRTYTIWEFASEERALELRVHMHDGDGIGLRWALEVTPGQAATFWWPRGDFFPRKASHHLFVGEETASAAFGPIIRALGPSARVYGVLESESAEHDLPMPGRHQLRRVHRHGASAVSSPTLLAGLVDLDLPGDPGAAYVAGEETTCQLVRDHLVRDRGWSPTSITVRPFWTPDRCGLL